jgi:hypothetical protein
MDVQDAHGEHVILCQRCRLTYERLGLNSGRPGRPPLVLVVVSSSYSFKPDLTQWLPLNSGRPRRPPLVVVS